ncbi:hypothetical protein HEP_00199700 [Hepatocystis sp. ex Piliocolobus tephrosceles]|nr:hypothetical protein HEP_00199700 [Hepatocystis sp. ex Piliocolobus tephrosceles]
MALNDKWYTNDYYDDNKRKVRSKKKPNKKCTTILLLFVYISVYFYCNLESLLVFAKDTDKKDHNIRTYAINQDTTINNISDKKKEAETQNNLDKDGSNSNNNLRKGGENKIMNMVYGWIYGKEEKKDRQTPITFMSIINYVKSYYTDMQGTKKYIYGEETILNPDNFNNLGAMKNVIFFKIVEYCVIMFLVYYCFHLIIRFVKKIIKSILHCFCKTLICCCCGGK